MPVNYDINDPANADRLYNDFYAGSPGFTPRSVGDGRDRIVAEIIAQQQQQPQLPPPPPPAPAPQPQPQVPTIGARPPRGYASIYDAFYAGSPGYVPGAPPPAIGPSGVWADPGAGDIFERRRPPADPGAPVIQDTPPPTLEGPQQGPPQQDPYIGPPQQDPYSGPPQPPFTGPQQYQPNFDDEFSPFTPLPGDGIVGGRYLPSGVPGATINPDGSINESGYPSSYQAPGFYGGRRRGL